MVLVPLPRKITVIIASGTGLARACYNGAVMQRSTMAGRLPSPAGHLGERYSFVATLVLLVSVALYAATLAPGTIYGDPSEYQFIPAVWGIAHPPGYAFYTLLAGVWQRVVAIGSVAMRTNLLAAFVGAWAASRVTAIVVTLCAQEKGSVQTSPWSRWGPALVGGLAVAVAPDIWQHSIHANAHIVSAALTVTQLWILVKWWRTERIIYLYALAWLVGIGVTHHPITVWGIPAYLVFILLTRPRIVKEWRTLMGGIGAATLGLMPWLYLPLRSPHVPFGPTDMASWDGFLRHATAQGLRVNLFHFGLADLPDRWRVFLSLLHLQTSWPLGILIVLGFIGLAASRPKVAVLWAGYLGGHLLFTMNSVQDVMAYLLNVFVPLGVLVALGLQVVQHAARRPWVRSALVAVCLALIAGHAAHTFPRITLHTWQDADVFVNALKQRFAGRGEGGALLSDWEHLTPTYYSALVEGQPIDSGDLRLVYVTGEQPWVESIFANLPLGDVYLTAYRRDVRDLGFRLQPQGDLYQVLEPPALTSAAPATPLVDTTVGGVIDVLGYDLSSREVGQGGSLSLVLTMRAREAIDAIVMPSVTLGSIQQQFTTDSRHLTPDWLPGELIVERYELYVPFALKPGRYPLALQFDNLGETRQALAYSDDTQSLELGQVDVIAVPGAGRRADTVARGLTNIGNQVLLRSALTRVGTSIRPNLWATPLPARPGQAIHVQLVWRVLAQPTTSYTVFIHVIDGQGQVILGYDYTPLGGAFPSYLWFPKWLEGQVVEDPYRLVLPEGTPPGEYWVEVGMYEMGSVRRVSQLNAEGVMTGDRLILGAVHVMP